MTGERNDDDLERAFAEWRAADMRDTRDAPRFEATYAAAQVVATKRAATAPWRRAAVAAAVLAVAGAGWFSLHARVPQSRLAEREVLAPSLSEWRSPTAFLLQGPGDMLVKTVPTFSGTSIELNALGVRAGHRRHL